MICLGEIRKIFRIVLSDMLHVRDLARLSGSGLAKYFAVKRELSFLFYLRKGCKNKNSTRKLPTNNHKLLYEFNNGSRNNSNFFSFSN